jgi:hypothetical protein
MLSKKLMLKCHCACNSVIGTCIIDDAGRPAAHKKNNENTRFKVESRQTTFYAHVLKVHLYLLTFTAKKKLSKKKYYQTTLFLKIIQLKFKYVWCVFIAYFI